MTPFSEIEKLSGEGYSLEHEQSRIDHALASGLEVFRPNSHELTFDLDGELELKIFRTRVTFLLRKNLIHEILITKSQSGNYHAVVKLNLNDWVTEPLRLAIQAALGSDWKREILGVLRWINDVETGSLLFRPLPLEVVWHWEYEESPCESPFTSE